MQEYLDGSKTLALHKLEEMCMPPSMKLPQLSSKQVTQLVQALDVYMDDFIGLSAGHSHEELLHFTHAVLHGIHTVFPPPELTEDQDDKPISVKKLKQGDGLWSTKKEILGGLFDGSTRCINLLVDKVEKILKSLKELTNQTMIQIGDLEKINGKLMHATIGIPNGHGLLSPLIATITAQPKTRQYKDQKICINVAT